MAPEPPVHRWRTSTYHPIPKLLAPSNLPRHFGRSFSGFRYGCAERRRRCDPERKAAWRALHHHRQLPGQDRPRVRYLQNHPRFWPSDRKSRYFLQTINLIFLNKTIEQVYMIVVFLGYFSLILVNFLWVFVFD